jgi:hypothetical protein
MSIRNHGKPEGSLDPEQVGEAASLTFKELRAKLGELRVVENIEQRLLASSPAPKNSSDASE